MELTEKNVLVYGAGKSGIGACSLLAEIGARPILFDENEALSEQELKLKLKNGEHVRFAFGKIPGELVRELDLVVLSPGVPTDLPEVMMLRKSGIPIIGEVELAYQTGKGRVLAITGTNGKTTTTSLVGAIMKACCPEVFVVGNIGSAYTGASLSTTEASTVVAEISSFQLETIREFKPVVSAILNITEDHLNRHHTMEEYIRVKEMVTLNQDQNCICVLNHEDPYLREFEKICPAKVFLFSSERKLEEGIYLDGDKIVVSWEDIHEELLDVNDLKLIGTHNYENVMAAAAVALGAGVSMSVIREVCLMFKPVAHRIEYIDEKNGVIWYNDSKGTNPDAAIKGIQAMKRPTFLIAGGYDKHSDYRGWIRCFGGRVKKLVLEGKTRYDIEKAALECGFPEDDIVILDTMRDAMNYCRDNAASGDAVLLSPACASWGEFPNYEVRGDEFRKYVETEI